MDARAEIRNRGNRHFRMAIVLVALFVCANCSPAEAQRTRVRARGGEQSITHTLKSEPQSFAPVRWDVGSGFANGCVVEWTAAPFTHVSQSTSRADCSIAVSIAQSNRRGRWRVVKATDRTNISSGNQPATVSIASERSGTARVQLSVQFLGTSVTNLAAGDYQTTITGTITGL